MPTVMVALYEQKQDAGRTIQALIEAGFKKERISLVAYDTQRAYFKLLKRQALGEETGGSMAHEAGLGALVGPLGGPSTGLLAVGLPGTGPVVVSGQFIRTLAEAGLGEATGGLLGALVKAGIPLEHVRQFADGVRRGETLVMVSAGDHQAHTAAEIMNRNNPVDLNRPVPHRPNGHSGNGVHASGP